MQDKIKQILEEHGVRVMDKDAEHTIHTAIMEICDEQMEHDQKQIDAWFNEGAQNIILTNIAKPNTNE